MKTKVQNTENEPLSLAAVSRCDYRIKEFDGKFSIERLRITEFTVGWFWPFTKKHTCKEWKSVDISGEFFYFSGFQSKLDEFDNLQNAEAKIQVFLNNPKYHYYNRPDFPSDRS